jgi:hypothetical protein
MLGVKSRFRGWSQCGEGANARWGVACSKGLQSKELVLGESSQCREEEAMPVKRPLPGEENLMPTMNQYGGGGGRRNCQEE